MAQKLHDQYGFSYNNLKVLLGGWNKWREMNSTDPTGYPIEVTAGASTPTPGSLNVLLTVAPVATAAPQVNPVASTPTP